MLFFFNYTASSFYIGSIFRSPVVQVILPSHPLPTPEPLSLQNLYIEYIISINCLCLSFNVQNMVSMTSESRGDNPFLPRTVEILNISGGNISSINFLKSSVGFFFPLLMALASVVAGNITPIPFTNSTFCTFACGIQ